LVHEPTNYKLFTSVTMAANMTEGMIPLLVDEVWAIIYLCLNQVITRMQFCYVH